MNDLAQAADRAEGVRIRGDGYTAEAGWFGPEDRPRFGWLYHPDKPAPNGAGIVIVPPFGREDICAHRSLRHLAEDAARSGFIALRFDLDGTGDSVGDDADPGRLEAWITSIEDACNLVRSAGAAQIVLAGVRLGALLATLAGARRRDIAAFVAFNAVVSGKAYLRELRAFQAAMDLAPPPDAPATVDEGQETSGFLLSSETCSALKAIDLAHEAAPAPVVWVLERDDMPPRTGWAEHLQASVATLVTRRLPGYVEMMADPHANHVAQAFIDACLECATGIAGAGDTAPFAGKQALRPRIQLCIGGSTIREEVVAPGAGLFGILARPNSGNNGCAVLMLNAGAIRHVGSNRMDVPLSRRLAAAGLQVLRADLSGIGDSPAREGDPENIVYGPHCLDDAGVLVAWLRGHDVRELAAGGMCSGAWLALRAAMAGQAIDTAYLVNCGVFSRKVAFDPEASHLFGDIAHYNSSMKSGRAWRKLLTGKVAFGAVARVATWHMRNRIRRIGKMAARFVRLPSSNDLGIELQAIARNGVRVHFLFSGNEPGRDLLATEAGAVVPRLCRSRQFVLRVLAGPDHTFTQRWAQSMLLETLQTLLTTQGSQVR